MSRSALDELEAEVAALQQRREAHEAPRREYELDRARYERERIERCLKQWSDQIEQTQARIAPLRKRLADVERAQRMGGEQQQALQEGRGCRFAGIDFEQEARALRQEINRLTVGVMTTRVVNGKTEQVFVPGELARLTARYKEDFAIADRSLRRCRLIENGLSERQADEALAQPPPPQQDTPPVEEEMPIVVQRAEVKR